MNCTVRHARRRGGSEPGMALVIVMILVLALAVIAGVFSHKIQVEAKLTANTRAESDLEWLGRSGVEVARWVLATEKRAGPTAQVDSFRDFWAGGPGVTNAMDFPFEGVSLDRIELGAGWCSVRIIDQERKININSLANRNVPPAQGMRIMEHALNFVGAEGMERPVAASRESAAILSWVPGKVSCTEGSARVRRSDETPLQDLDL
jgi:type II secretory pathway component PulK